MGEVGRVGSFPESYPVYCAQQRDRIGTSRLKTSVEQRATAVSSPGSCLFTSAYSTNVHTSPKCCAEPVRYATLHFRDRRGAASLRIRYRNLAEITVLIICVNRCPIRHGFRAGTRAVRYM